MNNTIVEDGGLIRLSGELTVHTAAEIWPKALAAMRGRDSEALIDMEEVTALDTAGVQILLMLRRLASASGTHFGIRRPSEAARQVLDFCGFGELILNTDAAEAAA